MALVALGPAAAGGTTEVEQGDSVELRLPEPADSAHRWRWRVPEALRLVTDVLVDGERRLLVEVTTGGTHELRAELALPWEGHAREAHTFVLLALWRHCPRTGRATGPGETVAGRTGTHDPRTRRMRWER